MVSNLSFLFSMLLALIIAGTAQAKPLIMGIILLPFNPAFRMSLSVKKLIRAIYPESSIMVTNPKRIIICGTKIKIPLKPATKPFKNKLVSQPAGKIFPSHPVTCPKPHSIALIGYWANEKIL